MVIKAIQVLRSRDIISTRSIVRASIVAALYAALTVAISPLSYGPIQFRVAEVLKPLALFDPAFILGFAIGNLLSNLTSPYVGPWELVFMPVANLVGASLCWLLRRWPYVGAVAYAAVITLAVATMLDFVTGIPWWALAWSVGISEFVLIIGGVWPMTRVWRAVEVRFEAGGPLAAAPEEP
jgi:uncharacterized membrane protein